MIGGNDGRGRRTSDTKRELEKKGHALSDGLRSHEKLAEEVWNFGISRKVGWVIMNHCLGEKGENITKGEEKNG